MKDEQKKPGPVEWWELELRYVRSTGNPMTSVVIHNRQIMSDQAIHGSMLEPESIIRDAAARVYRGIMGKRGPRVK